ncbi:MAG: response regulator transcription factor [Dehalococcoidia bacterium]|nr:response regulator transcription factor [Dehalococcoidia bacterium]
MNKKSQIKEKILIVEDQPQVIRLVTEVLRAVGYDVIAATGSENAVEMLVGEQPSLILLDIMFPRGPDGFELCRQIRQFSDLPVIMLTARARDNDILKGFDAGADDYLTKPFNAKELIARVQAVLRRTRQPDKIITTSFRCGDLIVNFARRSVQAYGKEVSLTRTEFSLLRELALNPNRVMLNQDLLNAVWGKEYRDDIDYLRAYIHYLRLKLEKDPSHPHYIVTSPGAGYMLVCPDNE